MHLHVGDAMPLKKTGVYLEPKVVFAEFIPKFKKKKNRLFRLIFGINSLKTIKPQRQQ